MLMLSLAGTDSSKPVAFSETLTLLGLAPMGGRTPPSTFLEYVDPDKLHLVLHVEWQGMYAGEVGVPRLLTLFKKYGITTSWFIPGEFVTRISSRICLIYGVLRT